VHGLEGRLLGLARLGDLDQVQPEGRAHGLAHLPERQAEGRVLERLHHHAALEPAEIAALCGRARIVRELLGERGEVLAGAQSLERRLRLGLRRGERVALGIGIEREQDVAGAALRPLHELVLVLLEIAADRRLVGLDGGGELGRVELQVLDLNLLRAQEVVPVLLEVGRDLLCGRRDPRREVGGLEHEVAEVTGLLAEPQGVAHLGLGREGRAADALDQLVGNQQAAQLLLEGGLRHALLAQGLLVDRHVELTVALEGRHRMDGGDNGRVAGPHLHRVCRLHQQDLADHPVERLLPTLRQAPLGVSRLGALAVHGGVEIALGDLLAVHRGDRGHPADPHVLLDAP